MLTLGGLDYAAVFAVTLVLTLVLTPLALRFAERRHLLDHPGRIKAQASPVPYLGGAAIVVAFAIVVLVASLVRRPNSGLGELGTILGLAVMLAVLGLVDDIKGLSPWLRLGVEVVAGIVVSASAVAADMTGNAVLDGLITVVWVVGVTNAVNLLDNMDGLSAGVSGIAALVIFAMAAHNGQFLVATLSIGLAGCAAGFLRSNFHPARIYMGDAGALFLGFMLAVLGLKLRFTDAPPDITFAIPILVLGVPLFDTVLVSVNRLLHHRSPLSGGRDHTSHRLVFVGIPVPAAVALIYVAAASLGVLAVVLSRVDRTTGLLLLVWLGGLVVLFGVILSMVPVYESSRRRHLMLQEVERREPEEPEPDDDQSDEPRTASRLT